MEKALRKTAHGVYLCQYHLVLVTKYRRSFLHDGLDLAVLSSVECVCGDLGYAVEEIKSDGNHIHVLLSVPIYVSPLQVIKDIKAQSTLTIWELWAEEMGKVYGSRHVLWSDGYCLISTGGASADVVRDYIKNQGLK